VQEVPEASIPEPATARRVTLLARRNAILARIGLPVGLDPWDVLKPARMRWATFEKLVEAARRVDALALRAAVRRFCGG
jgi:hypothetical protein